MAIDYDKLWAPADDAPAAPGVTAAQLDAWEARHGVKLPKALRKALRVQNGGLIRYSLTTVHSLAEIVPVEADFWEHASYSRKKFPNLKLVFHFANDDDEPPYFLNYNANGPDGEPTVYHWYHDPGEVCPTAKTVARFLAHLAAVSPTPAVDWSETQRLDEVLFYEKIDTKSDFDDVEEYDGREVYEEVVLGRLDGQLVHYTHEIDAWKETFTRTVLPEPLSRSDASIDQERPAPGRTYGLHLEPKDGDGIVCTESEQQEDGLWKNGTDHGVPVYITVESRSKDRLKELREKLFGKKAAKKAQARDDDQERMETMLQGMTPEQQRAAGLAMVERMFDEMTDEIEQQTAEAASDPAVPPELRAMLQAMQGRMDELEQRVAAEAAATPADPAVDEVAELMARLAEQEDEDEDDDEDEPGK